MALEGLLIAINYSSLPSQDRYLQSGAVRAYLMWVAMTLAFSFYLSICGLKIASGNTTSI